MKPTTGRKLVRKLLPALLLLPLAAGCAQIGQTARTAESIDPPPTDVEQTMLQETDTLSQGVTNDGTASSTQTDQQKDQATSAQAQSQTGTQTQAQSETDNKASQNQKDAGAQSAASKQDELTVYLEDGNGYIAPMTLHTGSQNDTKRTPAETAVAWMTKNADNSEQLPAGFSPILPDTTKIKSIKSKNGTVSIDFASAFPTVPASEERKMVEALVWTMTELPGVQSVKLTVDGQALRELPASGLPLPETLSRNIGINLEEASGLAVSRSMPVTLYFSARSEQGDPYFVPVTRLVNRQADRNRAALQELIKGPLEKTKLEPVLTDGVTVGDVTTKEDTVTASLVDPGWEPEMTVPSETMEALVLTLTEASGDAKASITFNGTADFTDTDNRSYEKPVDRPTYINALSR